MKVDWKETVLRKFGKVNGQWEGWSQSSLSEEFTISQEYPALLVHSARTEKNDWEWQPWCDSGNGFLNATAGDIAQLCSPQLEL